MWPRYGKELQVRLLHQGLAVEETSLHVPVGTQDLGPPRCVDHPPMKSGLPYGLSDPVAEVEADGLDETTPGGGGGRRSSQEKAPKMVKERSHIHNMHS